MPHPDPSPRKPLRAVPSDESKGWKTAPDYFGRFFLHSNSKDNLGQPFQVRLDNDVQVEMAKLLARGSFPHQTQSEFVRDAVTKYTRFCLEEEDKPETRAAATRMWNFQESEHRANLYERNKKFLDQQKKALDNAVTGQEVSRVMELCKAQEGSYEGKQLEELEDLVRLCRRRLET